VYLHKYIFTLAGQPTAVANGGISFKTTADAPILAPSPMLTLPRMLAPAPTRTYHAYSKRTRSVSTQNLEKQETTKFKYICHLTMLIPLVSIFSRPVL
jgi:hypothetical protein